MKMQKILSVGLIVSLAWLSGCSKCSEQPMTEAPPEVTEAPAAATPAPAADSSSPSLAPSAGDAGSSGVGEAPQPGATDPTQHEGGED